MPGVSPGTTNVEMPDGPAAAGSRHHDIKVAGAGPGNELLLTVEDIRVAVTDGASRQRRGVRSGRRLGQAIARQKFHGAELRQPGLALGVGPVGVDHPRRHVVDRHVGGDGRATGRQGLKDQRGIEPRQRRSAHVGGDIDPAHAEFRGLAHFGHGKIFCLVPGDGFGCEHIGGEGARHVADRNLVLAQGKLRGCTTCWRMDRAWAVTHTPPGIGRQWLGVSREFASKCLSLAREIALSFSPSNARIRR